MKQLIQLIRWIFFSNLLPEGEEIVEIAWVAGMGSLSALFENVALAVAASVGEPVLDLVFTTGMVWLIWMMIFAVRFWLVGSVVMPTGLALVAYGFNTAPDTWSLLETVLGFWMTLRCFSVGYKRIS
jgi:hypothetical protein